MKNRNLSEAVLASGLLRPGYWIDKIGAFQEKLEHLRIGGIKSDCSRRSAVSYLALFVPIVVLVVLLDSDRNAIINDTILLFSDFEGLERFSSLWSNANADPLQALFDIFPSGQRLDTIPNAIANALFGYGMRIGVLYASSAVLLTLSAVAMARSIAIRWSVAILAGFLLPFMIMPTFSEFPLADDMFILWPILYYSVAGTTFVTALFWQIGTRSWRWSVLLTAAIIVVLIHLSIVQILHMTMMAPAILAMGLAALAASSSRAELASKIVCGVAIVAALAAAGIFQYLRATGTDNAQFVFYQELPVFMNYGRPAWQWILDDLGVVFYSPFSPTFHARGNVAGAVVVPLSQLGAVYLAVLGKTRAIRIFGRAMLVWMAAAALTIVLLHNYYYYTGHVYLGPDPRHFLEVLWPYYVICFASLIFAAAEFAAVRAARAGFLSAGTLKYVPPSLVLVALVAGCTPIVARALHWISPWPYFSRFEERNAVVDYLEPRIGIALDREFRGTAIFMPTVYDRDLKPYGVWRRETTFINARSYLGNDLGEYSLHHFNIPTLDKVTHNITPQFYLISRELLSRPGIDLFDRHFAGAATRLNEPILALLGVRFIMADYELPIGTERLTMPMPDRVRTIPETDKWLKWPLRIYELPSPNVGNYSPTRATSAKTAKQAILAMSRPEFDGRQMVVTNDLSLPDSLVAARGASMTVRLGGIALSAESTGQSVLVLPVQFSHCWKIVSGDKATLFRANLMQLGVLFSGKLRLELRQIFGPFGDSACRLEDAADAERLRMLDASGTVADESKPAGDGVNLIPGADALNQTIGNSAVASIAPVGASDTPVRAYKIAAEGPTRKRAEHYLALDLPQLAPGVYTLSMQVPKDTGFMALQMKDGADNGAHGEYLVSERQAWIFKIGKADKLDGTIRATDDDWFQITLTAPLSTETGNRIFIRLKDAADRAAFKPRGEAITIRAVKLERGEKATPAARLSVSHASN